MCPHISVNVTDVVKLVGGRFMHLRLAALKLRTGLNMELLKEYLFGFVKDELEVLEIKIPPSNESFGLLIQAGVIVIYFFPSKISFPDPSAVLTRLNHPELM